MKSERHTWVLLRGLGREKGHWGPFADQFVEEFKDDEVLQLDLPGVGEFRDRISPATMTEIFQFVRAQAIERARAQSSFRLVTISLGSMVAIEWMKQKPDDLSGCVLINTSLRSLSPVYHRLRWQIWTQFAKILTIQAPREREKAVIDLIINHEDARARAWPTWTKIASDRPVSYRTLVNQLLAASRFHALDHTVDVPVLLLNSLGDRFVDPSCTQALHNKWGWPIERHPWGGHDLTWDDPAWVLQKIKAWSQSVDAEQP